jgi:2-keto-4-pentenoate hydratase
MSMDEQAIVSTLFDARRSGAGVDLGDVQLPFDKAFAVQLAVAQLFADQGDQIGAWKVGMTSGRSRDMMGADFRPFGYVLQNRILQSGNTIELGTMLNCQVEPELCLILGSRLSGPVSVQEARNAVRGIAPAFEVNEVRVHGGRDADHGVLIADGLGQWGIVIGAEVEAPDDLDGIEVELRHGEELETRATGGDTVDVDDPYLSLSRLAGLLGEHGHSLEAGQPVITGSYAAALVDAPGVWTASFSSVGDVSIEFT